MIRKPYDIAGLTFNILVPETVEEFNAMDPTRENACLAEANSNCVLRGCSADIRWELAKAIEKESQVPMERKPKVNSKGEPVMKDGIQVEEVTETEAKYIARVCAQKGCEVSAFAHLVPVIESLQIDGEYICAVDPKQRERKSRETGPGKRILEVAKALWGLKTTATKVFNAKVKNLRSKTNLPIELGNDEGKNIITLAIALQAFAKAEEQALLEKLA